MFATLSSFTYLCNGFGGEIPNRRCISLLFRAYRKDLGNLFWNSSNKKHEESQRKVNPLVTSIMLCTRPLAWSILICDRGSNS